MTKLFNPFLSYTHSDDRNDNVLFSTSRTSNSYEASAYEIPSENFSKTTSVVRDAPTSKPPPVNSALEESSAYEEVVSYLDVSST